MKNPIPIIRSNNFYMRSKKNIKYIYESIDFNYKRIPFYKFIIIKPGNYKIPNVPYKKQYDHAIFNYFLNNI